MMPMSSRSRTPGVSGARARLWSVVVVVLLALTIAGLSPLRPAFAQSAPPPGPSTPTLPAPDPTGEAALAGVPVPDAPAPVIDPASVLPPPPAVSRPKPGEELLDRRTATSKTFIADELGQLRTTLYEAPVHFKDAQGRWVGIDDSLGASKDGRRSNGPNVFGLSIADKSTNKALARMALDDKHSVGFALDGAAEVKGTGDAKSVTYAKVRKDTDVRLTSRRTGVKEELVLASPAAPDRFVFPLELKGLTASLNEAGDVIYRDAAGVERARTPHGFMIDANIDPRSQEAPMSLGVTYALIPFKGGIALEVRLDRAWLDDPARIYPITVDPEIHNTTSGDDTYVMSGFSRDNSYDAELKVGTYDGGAHIGRSYMHFDTSALASATVQRAELHLAERHSWNCTYWPEHVFRVTQGWNGRTMRDFPGAAVDPTGIGGTWNAGPCGGRDAQWDVTGIARYWASVKQTDGSLSLRATNESDNNRYKKYASTEAGAPPRLDVWFTNSPPAVPYNVTPANNQVFPSPYTSVSATYSDPDGTPGVMAIGVWTYPGNQLVWSTWTGTLCSGCGASYNVPALAAGSWYYVMAIGHDGVQYSSAWSSPQYFFIDTLAPEFPSSLTPAAGATAGSPVPVSAVYREPYGFRGRVIFQVNNAAGQMAAPQVVSGYVASGETARATVAPLSPGTYTLYAWSYDDRQLAGWSGGWAFNVAATPGAPASINARGEPASAQVSWGAVPTNGSPVSSVTITARDTVSGAITTKGCTTCVGSREMVYDGLTPGRSYQFWAAATNAVGAGPAVGPSNTVQAQELSVFTPRIESAVSGDREVVLTWTYLLDLPLVTTFYVQGYLENQTPIGQPLAVPASIEGDLFQTTYRFAGLRNGTRVYFTVSANILGLIQSPASPPSAVVVPAGVPFQPGMPQAQPRDQKVLLSWSAPSVQADGTPGNNGSAIDSYEVAVYSPPDQLIRTVSAPAPSPDTAQVASFEVGQLTNLTEYFFKVRAHNAKGFGEFSNPSTTVRPIPSPAPPTDVTAIPRDGRALVGWVAPDPDTVPVASYRVAAFRQGSSTETAAVVVGPDPTAVSLGGLTNGVSYVFTVVATNDSGSSAPSAASSPVTPKAPVTAGQLTTPLAEGRQHTLVLMNDGTVFAWGANAAGQLGDGTTTDNEVPGGRVSSLSQVVSVAAGDDHSLALKADDTVWAWGANGSGQLGSGAGSSSTRPIRVPGLSGVSSVAAGASHSLALLSDGTVVSWGANGSGQLGRTGGSAPAPIPGLTNVTSITASGNYSLVTRSDGSVWGWGDNTFGQLGSAPASTPTPVRVGTMSGIRSLSAGGTHALALASDGAVWSWGANETGQLGSGDMLPVSGPIRVQSVASATRITAGARHSVATAPDGTAWAWGANELLQLGNNDTLKRPSAVAVQVLKSSPNTFLSGVLAVAGRGNHTVAITTDGVREWGAHLQIRICVVADPKETPEAGSQPKPVPVPPPVDPRIGQREQQEHLFRGGSRTNMNFTPRPGNDTDGYPFNGLSTYDTQQAACFSGNANKKAQVLARPAVEAIPNMIVQPDLALPGHYFLRADSALLHEQWANTRPTADISPHRLTSALGSTVIFPDVPCSLAVFE